MSIGDDGSEHSESSVARIVMIMLFGAVLGADIEVIVARRGGLGGCGLRVVCGGRDDEIRQIRVMRGWCGE